MRWLPFVLAGLLSGCATGARDTAALHGGELRVAAATSAGTAISAAERFAAQLQDDRVVLRDGTALPLRRWLPETRPRAVVLALHGFNDYSNAFAAVGPALARDGIAVYAYDQRGFGRAPGAGRWFGEDRLVDDAATAAALLHRDYPDLPLYLMGESMGGAVAILAANRSEIDGTILVAPAIWGRATMNIFERVGLWLADLMPAVTWSADLLPVHIQPSDNLPMLRAMYRDPLVIKETRSDAVNGLVDLMSDALAAAPRFTTPSLILYGEQDQIVPRPPMARFTASLPAAAGAQRRIAFYPRGYHMLLRDIEAPLVLDDIAAWIADRNAPLPSGADRDASGRLTGERRDADAGWPKPHS